MIPGPEPPRNGAGGYKVTGLGAIKTTGYPTVKPGEPNRADCGRSPCGHTLTSEQWKPSLERR